MTLINDLTNKLPNAITGETYPVTAYIFKERVDNVHIMKDKAARIEDDRKQQKYKLAREGVETAPVDYDRIYPVEQDGGQQDTVFIWSPNKNVYRPFTINDINDDGSIDVNTDDSEWENFRTVSAMNERQDWKEDGSWWEENSELIAIASLGMMILLSMIGFGWAMDKMMEQMTSSAEQFKIAAETLAQAVEQINQ